MLTGESTSSNGSPPGSASNSGSIVGRGCGCGFLSRLGPLPLALEGAAPEKEDEEAFFLKLSPDRVFRAVDSLFVGARSRAPCARRCLVDRPLPELTEGAGAGGFIPREGADPLRCMWGGIAEGGMVGVLVGVAPVGLAAGGIIGVGGLLAGLAEGIVGDTGLPAAGVVPLLPPNERGAEEDEEAPTLLLLVRCLGSGSGLGRAAFAGAEADDRVGDGAGLSVLTERLGRLGGAAVDEVEAEAVRPGGLGLAVVTGDVDWSELRFTSAAVGGEGDGEKSEDSGTRGLGGRDAGRDAGRDGGAALVPCTEVRNSIELPCV